MKTLFLLPFFTMALNAYAIDYYVSSNGNDANNGTSTSTPWKTLNKINAFFGSLKPGDKVLLNRGDIFYGTINVSKSGIAGSPITIGAYGTGAKPIITGFTTVTNWTSLGGNIWESTSAVSTLSYTNMVTVGGVNTAMGRIPNAGAAYSFQSHTGTGTSSRTITSSDLTGTPNWTGAEISMYLGSYNAGRYKVTGQSGSTLTYATTTSDEDPIDGNSFVIQNDLRTLDAQNEWYYNPVSKKLSMYSVGTPSNVQIATVDTLVSLQYGKDYITFENLDFRGINTTAIVILASKYTTIRNCDFSNIGNKGVMCDWAKYSTGLSITGCNFNNILNIAIQAQGDADHANISNNNLNNIGSLEYMFGSGETAYGIFSSGAGTIISNNTINNTGYTGIAFFGNNMIVKNNLVSSPNLFIGDGAGIYVDGNSTANTGMVIQDNIVLGSVKGHGIYLDAQSNHVSVLRNTVSNCPSGIGIFLNNVNNVLLRDNTVFDCAKALNCVNVFYPVFNATANNNIFFAKTATQLTRDEWLSADGSTTVVSDSNYYARPIDDNLSIESTVNSPFVTTPRKLSGWQTYSGMDAHSKKSPKKITDVNDLRFEYNATTSDKIISLDAKYIDVTGKSYSGTITLAPYSSVVLIRDGTVSNQPPKANAGPNKTITLPINTVSLSGSGSDADGTISSYLWTKTSGPSTYKIIDAGLPVTDITGLVEGIYQFELKVTDDKGAAGRDTVQVTVNAAANIPPTANAGANKTITLPTSTVSLSGSGSDIDGTISNYLWTKNSGPSAYNIVNAGSPVTDVTGLVEGIYQFQLQVTDNKGATATSTVQITVNTAANIPPTASAGANKTITLPTNSTSLSGSGSDTDGTISNYLWTKTSGPSVFNIVNAGSPVTDVTGLVEGIYQFELKVTDDKGAIATSTIQVTVNAALASNIPPIANAGENKTITLPINSTSLSGSGTDADGTISSYLWTKTSGPSKFKIASVSSPVTDIKGLEKGVYQFELKVTDDKGSTASSTVQVTVNAATNTPPKANAGANKKIKLPTSTTSLAGSGSDTDGIITNYRWAKTSGPSTYNIVNAESPVTDVTGLQEGVYQFELEVTDNNGATATSTVEITVDPATNISPKANAGANQTITLPANTISLAGSGSDTDGTITNYLWTKISGPSTYNIVNAGSPVTDVTGLEEGVYQFELKVTDNQGETATSAMQITVNAAPPLDNIPPIANAGADVTITLPVNSVNLSGNGMDADGMIAKYQWKQISGPSGANITTIDKAGTSVTNLTGGTYEFEFTVTDNKGAAGKDTMVLVVALGRMSSQESNGLKVYPNPVRDMATVGINTAAVNTNLVLTISDMNGRVIYKKVLQSTQNVTTEKINMTNYAKGTYMVTVIFNEASKQTFKIIKL